MKSAPVPTLDPSAVATSEESRSLDDAPPLFSIVVPLEFHRGQWKRCLQAWQAQTLDNSLYEVLLVLPPEFPDRNDLTAWLALTGSAYRLVTSGVEHDIALCAFGAQQARGRFLFFTESHCYPQPDVLELCRQAFDRHPDWAGFSCRSLAVTPNRLAEAEAEMYDADIAYGLTLHPWRKVLDQCFVTRREAYAQCGGLKTEFGHFSEWVLAASYHEHKLFIGYLPEACFHHFYIGNLRELREFTLDFVRGEIRFLAQASSVPGAYLIETPEEWFLQGNYDQPLARALLKRALHEAWREKDPARRREWLTTARRWLVPAILGDRLSRASASVAVIPRYISARFANLFGTRRNLSVVFKAYLASLIHRQRLASIAGERNSGASALRQGCALAPGCNIFSPLHAGFFPAEGYQDTRFRWSETAAMVRISLPAGRHRICIACAPARALSGMTELRFHLDGRLIPASDIMIEPSRIVIRVAIAADRLAMLGWTCSRFDAPGDPRLLGLPVSDLRLDAAA